MNRLSMWCGMLAAMLALPAGGRAGEIGFGELFHPVALETTPQGLAVGDLDGDGRADLAITHYGGAAPDSLVRLYRGDGRGGFTPAGDLTVRKWSAGVAIGDLDGDAKPDLAVASHAAGVVSILRGRGDMTFEPRSDHASGLHPVALTVADVDGDGHDDLVAVNFGNGATPPTKLQAVAAGGFSDSSSVRVFLSGRKAPAGAGAAPAVLGGATDLVSGAQPVGAAVGDVDGDGRADIVAAFRGSKTIAIWFAEPQGGFTAPVEVQLEEAPSDVAIADVTGDGRPDVVAVLSDPSGSSRKGSALFVLPGGSRGGFEPRTTWYPKMFASRLAVADVDADGKTDVVLLCREGIGVLRGRGDGTFAEPAIVPVNADVGHAVADLDGDHKLDVVTLHSRGKVALVLHGNGDGTFGGAPTLATGDGPTDVESADLNGDKRADLVSADAAGSTVSIFLARSQGGFEPRRSIEVGESPMRVVSGDLDGDRDTDLVVLRVRGRASEMALLRNRGDGTFDPKESLATGIDPTTVEIADLNGDRKPDLLVPRATPTTEILFYPAKGRGQFDAARRIPLEHRPDALATGDMNRDGKVDLVAAEASSGVITVLLGKGDGTFTPALPVRSRYPPSAVSVADVNGDGKPDLVVVPQPPGGTGAVVLGAGDGTFGMRLDFEIGPGAGAPLLADLDGDGRLDLAAALATTGCVAVLPGSDKGFGSRIAFGAGQDPAAVTSLDFDGDGRLDLVAAGRGAGVLSLHRNLSAR